MDRGDSGGHAVGLSCSNWSVVSGGSVPMARTVGGPGLWSHEYAEFCGRSDYHLYCLQRLQDENVELPLVPDGGKLIFYTSGDAGFRPGGGRSAADQHCTDHSPLSFPGRTYRALLATAQSRPKAVIDPTARYYRPDGIFVGLGSELSIGIAHNGFWVKDDLTYEVRYESDGGVLHESVRAWVGSLTPDSPTQLHCNNWTISDAGVSGYARPVNVAGDQTAWLQSSGPVPCDEALPLICVEP